MAKQSELRGIERPKVVEIEKCVDDYVRFSEKHKALGEEKKSAGEALVMAMQRAKIKSYRYDGRVINLLEVDKIRIVEANGEREEEP